MIAEDVMVPTESVAKSATGTEIMEIFREKRLDILAVVDSDGTLVGTITWDSMVSTFQQAATMLASQIMSTDYVVIPAGTTIDGFWEGLAKVTVVTDALGKPLGYIDYFKASKLMAQKFRQRIGQLASIMESAHNAIIAIDAEGKVTFFNEAAERIVWRKKEEVIGKHLSEVVIPTGLLNILKTGQPQLCHKFTVDYSRGTRVYMTHRTPIIEEGKVVGAVGVFQDISEIEAISEELESVKRINNELKTIIDASYDAILVTDGNGQILRVNQAFERLTHRETPQSMTNLIKKVVAKKGPVTQALDLDGRQLMLTGNPVKNERGELERIVINIRDLTELNSLRRQLAESQELSRRYHSEIHELRSKYLKQDGVVFTSEEMQRRLDLAVRVARVDSTVLILGESGVGKEIIAKVIHNNSKRKDGPFIKVNCGAIPGDLLESELFGYESGAFTGAAREGKMGMFELANNGTLFLDEIGDLPLDLQVKLLRVIQDCEIIRVGGTRPRKINVRILAATNKNLQKMVERGEFRDDLYFRLNVVPIHVPPLRERKEDIIPLAKRFKEKVCNRYQIQKDFSPEVLDCFLQYDWPGNVRELENMVERLLVTARGPMVELGDLPPSIYEPNMPNQAVSVEGLIPLKRAVYEVEKQLITRAMDKFGSTYRAAKLLGVDQSTVARKWRKIRSLEEKQIK